MRVDNIHETAASVTHVTQRNRWKNAAMFGVATALCVAAVAGVVGLGRYREAARDTAAAAALQQVYLVMNQYAATQRYEMYPPAAPFPDVWTPDLRVLYPTYLKEPDILVSPLLPNARTLRRALRAALDADPPDWETAHRIAAQSVLYTGVALELEADLERFIAAGMPKDEASLPVDVQPLYRLRSGIIRFFIRDQRGPQVQLPATEEQPAFLMEQPALRNKRRADRLLAVLEPGVIVSINWGDRFPALDSVAQAFPPPAL